MAFDFPSNPTEGQEYSTPTGLTYVFNAPSWKPKPAGSSYVLRSGDTMTGDLVIDKVTPQLILDKSASNDPARITSQVNGIKQWHLALGDASTNFGLTRYDVSGNALDSPIYVEYATGLVQLQKGQLKFPAAANLSTDKNTLDDYHEDAWPSLPAFAAAGCTFSYASRYGAYTKVGNLVHVEGSLKLNTSGNTLAANALTITGLPFAAINSTLFPVLWWQSTTAYTGVWGRVVAGASVIDLHAMAAAAVTNLAGATATGLLNATTGSQIDFAFSYRTAGG